MSGLGPPTRVGRWRLGERLGEGGAGAVYRATDAAGQRVALKLVREANPLTVDSLRREIWTLSGLRHPGIANIVDHGAAQGLPWYAMEAVDGEALRHSEGMDQPQLVAARLATLCDTLAYLHGEGVVHRDVKPANVLVPRGGDPSKVVLVDFGLRALAASGGRERLELVAPVAGSIPYMAPEQIRGELVDPRADLYAVGCLLYELLAGAPPFGVGPVMRVLRAHLVEPPSSLHGLSHVDPRLHALTQRLLCKKPEERMGHAADVARALREIAGSAAGARVGPAPRPYLYRPRFAGRAALVGQLVDAIDDGCSLCVVSGRSGSGKTRLVMEALRALAQRVKVLSTTCDPRGGSALAPLVQEAVDGALAEGGAAEDFGGDRAWLAAFDARLAGPGREALPADAARRRTLDALKRLFDRHRGDLPLVIAIDDLHWGDALTVATLERLAGAFGEGTSAVATWRSEEAGPDLETLGRAAQVGLQLDALGGPALEAMIGSMLASAAPEALSQTIASHAEGNPFFVSEYLRAAVADGLLRRDEGGRWRFEGSARQARALPVPEAIRALVGRRLDRLGEAAAKVARVAAAIARELPVELLRAAGAWSEDELERGLAELLRAEILTEADQRVRFEHDKLREVVLERPLSADAERRIAAALDARQEWDWRVRAAWHWEAAGAREEALARYAEGAARAAEAFEFERAEALYERALGLAKGEARARLRVALARRVLRRSGQGEAAARVLREALAEAGPAVAGEARIGLAEALADTGAYAAAIESAREALEGAREAGDRALEAEALTRMGVALRTRGDTLQAEEALEAAATICRALGDATGEQLAVSNLALVAWTRGQRALARRRFEASLAALQALGDRYREAVVRGNMGNLALDAGEIDEAQACYEAALALHREVGHRVGEGHVLANRGLCHWKRGDLGAAVADVEASLAIQREVGDRQAEANSLSTLGYFAMLAGDVEEARAKSDEGTRIAAEIGAVRIQGLCAHARAVLERRVGALDVAERWAREGLAHFEHLDAPMSVLMARAQLGHLALARGASAAPTIEACRAYASERGYPLDRGEAAEALAALERAQALWEGGAHGQLLHGEVAEEVPEALS